MDDVGSQLGRGMRWLLIGCGPMNVAGAVCFSPPFPDARRGFGLAEPPAFYLWVLSAWILAFGWRTFTKAGRGGPTAACWPSQPGAKACLPGCCWPNLRRARCFRSRASRPYRIWRWRSCSPCGCGGHRGDPATPNQAVQQTAGYDSFFVTTIRRCPTVAERGR